MKGDSLMKKLYFILADDDADDRFFFEKALNQIIPETKMAFVQDGEKLMSFLNSHVNDLPDVLFLDLNMPRKNGSECLIEIRNDQRFDQMAIIIYTTGAHESVANILYQNGAHYYFRKPEFPQLSKALKHILDLLRQQQFERPERDRFILKIA